MEGEWSGAKEGQTGYPDDLMERLRRAEDHLEEYKRLAQWVQAELSNYKRRVEEEREEQAKLATAGLIEMLLPVVDSLDRALSNFRGESDNPEWRKGIELIQTNLLSVLEQEGLSRVEAQGMYFDPNQHEAIMTEETTNIEDGKIISVHQEGYMLHGRLLRPARVSVARNNNRGHADHESDNSYE